MYFVLGLVIILIFVALGAFLIWFGRAFLMGAKFQAQTDEQLASVGIDTNAEIVNHEWRSGSRSGPRYYITYRFAASKPDGTTENYTTETQIDSGSYHQLNVGDSIRVRYLADTPKSSKIVSGAKEIFTANVFRLNGYIGVGMGVVLAVIGLVFGGGLIATDVLAGPRANAQATADAIRESATPLSLRQTVTAIAAAATHAAATVTRTADDQLVRQVKDKLSPRLPDLRKAAIDARGTMLRLRPPETGLDMQEVEIDYGICTGGAFYVYTWLRISERLKVGSEIDTFLEGYGYVDGNEPSKCYPKEIAQVWNRNGGVLGDDWYAINGATEVKLTPTQ